MTKKPVIGISLDLAWNNGKNYFAPRPWYALRQDYAAAVEQAGGIPLMIPYSKDIDGILDAIDGLVISGGDEDVNPKFYGQTITSNKVKTNDERASFELELAKKALKRDMPIFGICNGMQVINVLCGGTLIQHIPDTHPSDINHEQPAPKEVPSHLIHIEADSMLAKLSNKTMIMVNTTHHQAVDKLAEGFKISAKAPDGIIEAIECDKYKFLFAVQWHSEYLNDDLDRNLFKKLIEASSS